MHFPTVKRNTLLLIAGTVWFLAGFNIMRIGTPGMLENWDSPVVCLFISAVVFGLFFKLVFYKMVNKHCKRIRSYAEERVPAYRFFDKKAYCIMTFMITFGILLRQSNLMPPLYIGVFYTGLGAALIGAGIFFFIRFASSIHSKAPCLVPAPCEENSPEDEF